MNKFVFIAILSAFLITQIGCSSDSGANQTSWNASNTAAASPTVTAANSNANANTATAQETPLPQFTNADEAIAEGVKLLDLNKTEKAIEALKQAVKLNPDSGEAYFRLGIAYAQIEKAEKEKIMTSTEPTPTPEPVKKAKKSKPGKIEEFVPTTPSEKAFAEAVKAYKKYLIKNPKDDAALYNLGRAYNKINQDDEAEKALTQAVKLKPEDSEYQTELGSILIKLAHYDDAVKALKKALDLDSSNLQAEELLDKAEAGKKRVDFGVPPKGADDREVPAKGSSRPKATVKPKADTPKTEPAPETKNVNK